MKPYVLFWFRQDLRLFDNPGLFEASKKGPILPVYIIEEKSQQGSASKWWLYHSLMHLNHSLGNNLNVYRGSPKEIFHHLLQKHPVQAVYWNRCYNPKRIQEDSEIKIWLKENAIDCKSFCGSLIWEPFTISKSDGTPYKVFTPFYQKGCLKAPEPRTLLSEPENPTFVKDKYNITTLNTLNLLSHHNWHAKLKAYWHVGERAAQKQWTYFLNHHLEGYEDNRNFPSRKAVSRLSPHLHFGEISPTQIWDDLQKNKTIFLKDKMCFQKELGWREFSYALLYHFPALPDKNFQSKFDHFPWKNDMSLLKVWQKGETGYPLVDAGMRELWETGYMHNRVRMITASFLVKNLRIHWHYGRDWFWDCLVDADLANNSASWQWVFGSGVDAAPYFRIFNPITQGEKFDENGIYTRHFVPELKNLPDRFLFKPWQAPQEILEKAEVKLGVNYPFPIVQFESSRREALEAYQMFVQNKEWVL